MPHAAVVCDKQRAAGAATCLTSSSEKAPANLQHLADTFEKKCPDDFQLMVGQTNHAAAG
jgi:hypothetical protein